PSERIASSALDFSISPRALSTRRSDALSAGWSLAAASISGVSGWSLTGGAGCTEPMSYGGGSAAALGSGVAAPAAKALAPAWAGTTPAEGSAPGTTTVCGPPPALLAGAPLSCDGGASDVALADSPLLSAGTRVHSPPP